MAIPREEISQPQSDREITEKTIKRIENADYNPTIRELVAIASALGMQLEITFKTSVDPSLEILISNLKQETGVACEEN